jgi:hypothetical protein
LSITLSNITGEAQLLMRFGKFNVTYTHYTKAPTKEAKPPIKEILTVWCIKV